MIIHERTAVACAVCLTVSSPSSMGATGARHVAGIEGFSHLDGMDLCKRCAAEHLVKMSKENMEVREVLGHLDKMQDTLDAVEAFNKEPVARTFWKTGGELIAAERKRQIEEEGCTPEHDEMSDERTVGVHAALEAAGYRCFGEQVYEGGAVLWQRREGDGHINVYEWPELPLRPGPQYEVKVNWHDALDAVQIHFYTYSGEVLVSRLPEIERRALAALEAAQEG